MSEHKEPEPETNSNTAKALMESLHAKCGLTIQNSFAKGQPAAIVGSFLFANELSNWTKTLADKREQQLYSIAEQEYGLALLSLYQGQYRNAFKGLRLVLELYLQGIHLSTNLVLLDEWLRRDGDTYWAAITDNENGVFSSRFCKAFLPEVQSHIQNFLSITRTLYRELSECIHGNIPHHIPLPTTVEFDEATFDLWHEKASTARLIVHFALSTRYLKNLSEASRSAVEEQIMSQLGHIEPIRKILGGV